MLNFQPLWHGAGVVVVDPTILFGRQVRTVVLQRKSLITRLSTRPSPLLAVASSVDANADDATKGHTGRQVGRLTGRQRDGDRDRNKHDGIVFGNSRSSNILSTFCHSGPKTRLSTHNMLTG